MKTKLISLAMGALLVGCTAASATGNYTITAEIPTDDFEGLTAYLVNFDTGEKIDSTMIDNGKAVFKGSIATPALARIIVDGNRMGSLVVENAEISTQHRAPLYQVPRSTTSTPLFRNASGASSSSSAHFPTTAPPKPPRRQFSTPTTPTPTRFSKLTPTIP